MNTGGNQKDMPPFIFNELHRGVVFGDLLGGDGANHAREGADSITDAHQDGSISWSNVQMVDVETRDGKAWTSHCHDQGGNGQGLVSSVAHHQEEQGLSPEPPTIEYFANIGGREDLLSP